MRRIAMLACLTLIAAAGVSGAAKAQAPDCTASPSAVPCVFAEKTVEGAGAECRAKGGPEGACNAVPYGHHVSPTQLAAYEDSWLHRTAQFQYELGAPVPFSDAQWLGTHNSFNAPGNGFTPSHSDSNQQLTLTQQLDADIRSVELDLHYVNGAVRVCHARPASEMHAGCTTEPTFDQVLPEIATWLAAHGDQVLLLYLEDALGSAGYAPATAALDAAIGPRIYRPTASGSGCTQLPLALSREAVLAAGKNVVIVGNCAAGWSGHVYGWNQVHDESGGSSNYTCSSPINSYASKLVRFFEDSTFLSAATAPNESMAARDAGHLTPAKVDTMVDCGVNLFGFDQFDPADGRVAASIWSWAESEPQRANGDCSVMGADGRWRAAPCTGVRPAACRTQDGWRLSPPVAATGNPACQSTGGTFSLPRTGQEAAALRALAAGAEVWLNV